MLARLLTVAQETAQLDLDALSDEQLRRCLSELRRPLAMLEATRSRLLATLENRAAHRVRPGGSVRGARDEERRKVAEDQRLAREQRLGTPRRSTTPQARLSPRARSARNTRASSQTC